MNVGDAVRAERDERAFPSQGSWSAFRGRPGFIVTVNHDGGPLAEDGSPTPEYGVILTTTRPRWRPDRPGELSYDTASVSWFLEHELRPRNG